MGLGASLNSVQVAVSSVHVVESCLVQRAAVDRGPLNARVTITKIATTTTITTIAIIVAVTTTIVAINLLTRGH